jgi:hypothetical protein
MDGRHQGETKCILARESVFWPGISNDIRQIVKDRATITILSNLVPRACDPWEGNEGSGIIRCRKPGIVAKIELRIHFNGQSESSLKRIIPEPSFPSRGSQARGTRLHPIQSKLPIMQPDLPTRPLEKFGTDIFEKKYLMIVDYYSRFPVIRLLNGMTVNTICNHFMSVLAEYGLPARITSDFGSQYVSEKFKAMCKQSGIILEFSSPIPSSSKQPS